MKHKFLPILLPILTVLFGYALGSTITQLSLEKQLQKEKTSEPKIEEETKKIKAQKPVPKKEEKEYETYTVQERDTLFGISLKFNIALDRLAEFNNITDPNQVKVGQVLKIPKETAVASETKTEIDLAKIKELQEEVDAGQKLWRLDPVEVTKAEAPISFEFSVTDTYTLKSKDLDKGEAEVLVKKTEDSKVKTYQVELIQPIKKGEEGIWAIVAIKELS